MFEKLIFVNFLGYRVKKDNAICILDIPPSAIYNKIIQKGLFYGTTKKDQEEKI